MPLANAASSLILVASDDSSAALERVPLSGPESTATYDEKWLQNLLYRHPEALPVDDIDSAYTGLIPICTEMSAGEAGYIDILYATSTGRLAILEAKLWRNPEARRKVIGQVLDYAKALSRWSYSTLDAQVQAARRREGKKEAANLFGVVSAAHPAVNESRFVDAVSRNLKRGEFLLVIAGDGIHEGVGEITDFLAGHGTLQFTFGLVEVSIYKTPNGGQLVQPRVLAQSEIVRRVVVDVRSDGIAVSEDATFAVDDAPDREVEPELARIRETFRSFWSEFLAELKLDDASQPIRQPSRTTNQDFDLPRGSKGWISAYVAQSVSECGVYLTFERGTIADRLYQALLADRAAIEKELGVAVQWQAKDGKYSIFAAHPYSSGRILVDHRADAKSWLADRVNRFVTVFRPRVEALVRDMEST